MKNANQNVKNANGYKFVNKLLVQVQELQVQNAAMKDMLEQLSTKLTKAVQSFTSEPATEQPKAGEGNLTKLRAEADALGLEYHHRTGSVKLQELIDAAKAATNKPKRGRPTKVKEEQAESESKASMPTIEEVRVMADKLGVTYHHRTGVNKLLELIDAAKANAKTNKAKRGRPAKTDA